MATTGLAARAKDARTMASKRVSPKGLGSGIRMIQYFINRGGKNLSPSRRRELERASGFCKAKRAGEAADGEAEGRRLGHRFGYVPARPR